MSTDDAKKNFEFQASLCAALGSTLRIQIIYELASKTSNVNQLAEALGASHSTTSRHLRALREQGLLRTVRRGPHVEYRLNDHRLIEALNLLHKVQRDRLLHRARIVQAGQDPTD